MTVILWLGTTGNCSALVGNYIRVLKTGEKLVYSEILYRNYISSDEANTMLVGYASEVTYVTTRKTVRVELEVGDCPAKDEIIAACSRPDSV